MRNGRLVCLVSSTLPEAVESVEKLNIWDANLCATVAALPEGQCGEVLQHAVGEQLQELCKLLLQVPGREARAGLVAYKSGLNTGVF